MKSSRKSGSPLRSFAVLFFAGCIGCVTGCGSKNAANTSTAPPASAAPLTPTQQQAMEQRPEIKRAMEQGAAIHAANAVPGSGK